MLFVNNVISRPRRNIADIRAKGTSIWECRNRVGPFTTNSPRYWSRDKTRTYDLMATNSFQALSHWLLLSIKCPHTRAKGRPHGRGLTSGQRQSTTGWYYADPLISAGIGLFILPRTWILLKDAVGVLLEGTPSDVDIASLRASLLAIEGVADIHDLHVWSLTSGVNAMSVHTVLDEHSGHDDVLERVHEQCTDTYKISHITVQTECADFASHETHF